MLDSVVFDGIKGRCARTGATPFFNLHKPEDMFEGGTVVIGCGNLLRGDDAVGPTLIRHLWECELAENVYLVDGGTGGMDVAFKMRGAKKVILVDACSTGATPGTLYNVPGEEVEQLPPLDGIHLHAFRWDHALAFGRWLLKDEYPSDIEVYLIEAEQTSFGSSLTPAVENGMLELKKILLKDLGKTERSNIEC